MVLNGPFRTVYANPEAFCRFIWPVHLNKHLKSYLHGPSVKVFRTYDASITFQSQLGEGTAENGTMQGKPSHYNYANRMMAIICDYHQAALKAHDQSMAKIKMKDLWPHGFKYDCEKLCHAHFIVDSEYKKDKRYAEDESNLDENAVAEHEEQCTACKIKRPEKKTKTPHSFGSQAIYSQLGTDG